MVVLGDDACCCGTGGADEADGSNGALEARGGAYGRRGGHDDGGQPAAAELA